MKLVMTLIQLNREAWWTDLKEVLGVLGPLIAGVSLVIATFTYRRNTDVRAQDVKANKIKRTHELMISYPGVVREKVLLVTKQLQAGTALIDEMRRRGVDERRIRRFAIELVMNVKVVELLHLLDPFGFLLRYPDYLFVDEALSTFASEVERVLLVAQPQSAFNEVLDQSSMRGIARLQKQLREHHEEGKDK
ncbi:hypothetical protein [Lacticaseibacillus porcinae]|uniref:hypothetical protein n=1 Tax=Lacticaseibacillus porcinae TaxID=1123687 RepID=UPI000F783586|nr:hypothetical protein [Lacticaseibacillus porcinae]